MSATAMSPQSGRSPLVIRSQSAPDGNPSAGRTARPHSAYNHSTATVSPRVLSPLGRTPSSGYGSTDHLTSEGRRSDQNNNYDKNKTKSLCKSSSPITTQCPGVVNKLPFHCLSVSHFTQGFGY